MDKAIISWKASSRPSALASKPCLGKTSPNADMQSSSLPVRSCAASGPPWSRSSSRSSAWKPGALRTAKSSRCSVCAARTCSEGPLHVASVLVSLKASSAAASSSSKASSPSPREPKLPSLVRLSTQPRSSSATLLASSVLPASDSGTRGSREPAAVEGVAQSSASGPSSSATFESSFSPQRPGPQGSDASSWDCEAPPLLVASPPGARRRAQEAALASLQKA
mmetsp:Transcript_36457/g.113622  ORF Transcript_36457/g.113622 Transcript_36457/m.113622 type:complete len:223 (+) Transcript_36457:415-1083(+)